MKIEKTKRKIMFAQLLAIVFFTTLVCSSVGAGLCCKNVTAAAKEGVDSGAISSVSITLSDDISMNFFVDKAQAGDAPYMEFSFNGNTARDDEPREEGEFYVFSYRGITPQHLNDTVTATAYTGDGTNIGSGEKSVRDYCGGLLSNDALHYGYDDVKYEAMTTLVADLLGYGAAAQLYKNEATDDLADSILAEYPSVSGSEFRALGQEDNILSFEGTADAAVMPVSATLRFDYNVELLFRYEVDATIAEGLSVAVEKNGNPTEAYTVEKKGEGDTVVYTIACNGLRAMEFDVPVSVRFLNGGEPIGLQTTYSVNSYIYEKQNDVETEGLQALVRATYLYGESAKHFYELPDISFDDGALKDNILEAEAAETDGGNLTVATNYRFSVDLSGGLALANINNTDGLNSLIFNFTSDKTAIVEVQARVSTFSLDHELENFSQAYTVSNNGKEVDVSGIDVPERGSGDLAYGTSADKVHGNYFTMVTIPLYVPVYKGNNSLMFTKAVYGLNFDYINIRTSANIEWEEHYPEDFENGTIDVVGIPNDTRTGSIRIEGANGGSILGRLPEYSYGCYDAVEEGGSLLHYLTVGNKRVDVTDYYAGEMYPAGTSLGDTVSRKNGSFSFWDVAADGNSGRDPLKGWYGYSNTAGYAGTTGVPVLQNGGTAEQYLEFTKASRFELFWVKDEKGNIYHLGDASRNWKPAPSGLYGQEYMYEMQMSADGAYNIELLGLSESRPTAGTSYKNGITFRFNGDSIEMLKFNSADVQATATVEVADFGDSTTRTFSFCVTRVNSSTVAVRLFIDGQKVDFTETEHYVDGYVENGTLYVTNGYFFGQRFSVIPAASTGVDPTTVKIYDLDIIKVTK